MSGLVQICCLEDDPAAYDTDSKTLNELREKFKDWLTMQPHLPQGSKMSLEVAKQKLDMYYTIRRIIPEIYKDRDPRGPSMMRGYRSGRAICLPSLTPEKNRVMIFDFKSNDPKDFHIWAYSKYVVAIMDIRYREDRCAGEIYIYDLAKAGIGYLTIFTPATLKRIEIVCMKAFSLRIKQVHLINAPSNAKLLLTGLKGSLNIHVHVSGNITSLFKFVPESILPVDYGGDAPSMDELNDLWLLRIDQWRDWFIEQENILNDESLRPGKTLNEDDIFGFSGSFRKLTID